ncbi:hypothetical protein Rhal01_00613 [Rubritalea halochordaticola]|uniref:Uncharacterized protein n=1 Tax=Rubritalea halochordaticola TaxID=714537 RepID=A0ABP9V1F3_9BACT
MIEIVIVAGRILMITGGTAIGISTGVTVITAIGAETCGIIAEIDVVRFGITTGITIIMTTSLTFTGGGAAIGIPDLLSTIIAHRGGGGGP